MPSMADRAGTLASARPMPDDRPASHEDLLALADALLAEAGEVRKQWADLHRALRGEPEETAAPEARRRESRREAPAADPRRLIAVEMMLAGRSRGEVEQHLRREYGDAAADEILAEVYGN